MGPTVAPTVAEEATRARQSRALHYLKALEKSANPDHLTAARMITELSKGSRSKVDLKIVHVRPAREGSQAYGPGLDTATRVLKTSEVDQIDILDVPY